MPKGSLDYVTVSPPTFDRTEFTKIDRLLSGRCGPYCREWLMARFAEGLQIRLLRPPFEGFVVFQPGRLAWRPVDHLDRAVFVHDIRVGEGALATEAKRLLWEAVEEFAQYYGYAMNVALIGSGEGAISPQAAPGRGWVTVDDGPQDTRLIAKILSGPTALPCFPSDWAARTNALGSGLVLQTTGESDVLEARADRITAEVRAQGVDVRRMCLSSPEQARRQAVSPRALFSVIYDGVRLGGAELRAPDIVGRMRAPAG